MSSRGHNNNDNNKDRKKEPRRVAGGKRRMQSYCLRYAMGVVEKQAQEIHGRVKDPAKRQKLERQTEEIIAKVRRRINEDSVPPEYLKAEDPCVENMEQLNRQRQAEIDTNEKLLATLQKQVKEKEKEIRKATKVKDERARKLDTVLLADPDSDEDEEDLLADFHDNDEGSSQLQGNQLEDKVPPSLSELTYQRAPKGTMAKFLKALSP